MIGFKLASHRHFGRAMLMATTIGIAVLPGMAHAASFGASAYINAVVIEQYAQSSVTYQYNYPGENNASIAGGGGVASGSASGTSTTAYATGSGSVPDGNAFSATASADLSTGSTHVSNINTGDVPAFGLGGTTIALLNDTLTFNAIGATASKETTIGVTFTIDGTMLMLSHNSSSGSPPSGWLESALTFGSVDTRGFVNLNQQTDYVAAASGDTYPLYWNGTWVITNGANGAETLTFNGNYSFIGASTTLPISIYTSTFCTWQIECSFGDTTKVALELPSNVSFTSASGVFLSGPTVPIPAAFWLVGSALAGLVGFARRKLPI